MTKPAVSQDLEKYLKPAFARKAISITAIDIQNITSYADTLVIVEANSPRQVTSMAEHIITSLKKEKIMAIGVEGIKEGQWALLDYGHVIIHVFDTQTKEFYDLEGLWSDGSQFDLSKFDQNHEKKAMEEDDE
ncbi:MAG: ribosome silencing factor [Desulfobacteraceae bacterium]|nr:ribosome silencing factor [Desulfobacteraceae bacterium]